MASQLNFDGASVFSDQGTEGGSNIPARPLVSFALNGMDNFGISRRGLWNKTRKSLVYEGTVSPTCLSFGRQNQLDYFSRASPHSKC